MELDQMNPSPTNQQLDENLTNQQLDENSTNQQLNENPTNVQLDESPTNYQLDSNYYRQQFEKNKFELFIVLSIVIFVSILVNSFFTIHSKSDVEDQIANLKDQLESFESKFEEIKDKKILEIANLKDQMESKFEEIKNKKILKIHFQNIQNFFKKSHDIYSFPFHKFGLTWFLQFRYEKDDNEVEKFLGIYLHVFDKLNSKGTEDYWAIDAQWSFRLISQNKSIKDKITNKKFKFTSFDLFFSDKGDPQFIEYEDLIAYYLKNDSITVEILFKSVDLSFIFN